MPLVITHGVEDDREHGYDAHSCCRSPMRRRGVPASTIGRTGQEVGLDGQPHDTHQSMAAKMAIPFLEPDQLWE